MLRKLKNAMPFAPNLSDPEYIPTRLMQFFDILGKYFPGHRLVTSDFHDLPDTISGVNAPVVQTRYQRRTVPVTTPLVGFPFYFLSRNPFLCLGKEVLMITGTSRLLRHPIPHRLQRHGTYVSGYHRQAYQSLVA